MIDLRMTDLDLSAPVSHVYTDWQVASDKTFTNIVTQSMGDATNLTYIRLDTPLDPEVKYYARSRALLSTGYTAWGNIDTFRPIDVGVGNTGTVSPSIVALPSITLPGSGVDVSVLGCSVTISPVTTVGSAVHNATSYVLEDINSNYVWSSLNNKTELLHILIPPTVLAPSKVYRLRVLVHTDSGDTAQLSTYTFSTETRLHSLIMTSLDSVSPGISKVIDVEHIPGITSTTGILYAIVNTKPKLIGTYQGSGVGGRIITIPGTAFRPHSKYLLKVTTNIANTWDSRVFTTLD